MPQTQEDLIQRTIRQIAQVLAAMLRRTEAGEFDEARKEADDTIGTLLGPAGSVAMHLDSATAAGLLQTDQVVAWAELLHARAGVERAAGREAEAAATERRAAELLHAATERDAKRVEEMRARFHAADGGVA